MCMVCFIDLLTYPYENGFENFLILSMIVIFPLSRSSRVILVVLDLPTIIHILCTCFANCVFFQVLFELGIVGYSAILSSILYICIELPWLNTEKFIFGMILRPRNQRKRIE